MRKQNHGWRKDPDQTLSAGRVEYLEAARQKVRNRRIRRAAIIVLVLAAAIAFASGFAGESVAVAKDFVDTITIAIRPDASWPQNTGIANITQVEKLSGAFVELGGDTCVVYSDSGSRLNSIQSGYARPALAAGKTRFVLYNRSGNEFRVESRTQNLYTKTTDNSIFLCAVADDGKVAVVTDDVRNVALLTAYSSSMDTLLTWELTASEGTPLRMAFSSDSRRLAVASVTASSGQMVTNIYVLSLSHGDPISIGTQNGIPQWLGWVSSDSFLVVYDSRAVLYYAGGGEKASYDLSGQDLVSISADTSGIALLLSSGQTFKAVMLNKSLNVQSETQVPESNSIIRSGSKYYLLTDDGVEYWSSDGTCQWQLDTAVHPQALIATHRRLLLFGGNTVQTISAPEQSASG